MNNLILPTEAHQRQPRIVPRESNLDLGQFFYPDERSKRFELREFHATFTDTEGNSCTTNVLIKPDATLGTLTTFDERVMYVLLELWKEQGKTHKVRFSYRELLRRLQTKIGVNTLRAIQNSVERLGGVMLRWESSFYIKSEDRYLELLTPFTIITNVRVATNKSKGIGAAVCEFSFNENFLNNLKANYCRPIRFDVVLSLKTPLAQAVYALFDASSSKKKIAELQLRTFNRRGQKVIRAKDFFKDKKLSILDFWQWDDQINPERLH